MDLGDGAHLSIKIDRPRVDRFESSLLISSRCPTPHQEYTRRPLECLLLTSRPLKILPRERRRLSCIHIFFNSDQQLANVETQAFCEYWTRHSLNVRRD